VAPITKEPPFTFTIRKETEPTEKEETSPFGTTTGAVSRSGLAAEESFRARVSDTNFTSEFVLSLCAVLFEEPQERQPRARPKQINRQRIPNYLRIKFSAKLQIKQEKEFSILDKFLYLREPVG
jgi:hypothetical protein